MTSESTSARNVTCSSVAPTTRTTSPTRMTVGELLSLHPGEVVELDRAASAPADLLVNGTLIARGEVVVVDEDFGLRISEIVTDAAAELGAVSS